MSPLGPENFYRLEEFPSFISCIKCFGRPIIPPLLTSSRRHELKQLRIAAINKEVEKLSRKTELLNHQKKNTDISSKTYRDDDCRSGFQSNGQESCALWYPSAKDCQEGISVAISKLPTSGIYSSVHTGAIVCSNVIEDSSHAYTTTVMRDSLLGAGTNAIDCVECSHNNINLECSLCQAEYNQSFHNKSFSSEISPEVPCRTFSLLQQNVDVVNDELNCAVEETECESLPTVIYNQKYIPPDTDTESNITSMTQSTDLEKYMEMNSEFSPDCHSYAAWESKSASQQYMMSRSDDASSETIVNTENELTPCASTMAELTDNIEDEYSTAEEMAAVSDKEMFPGTLKRAHSVDSYMKIIQTCAKSMNVKKSLSAPFNTDLKTLSGSEEVRPPISLKTSFLIKEDSKESDEAKDVPEKDTSDQGDSKESFSKDDKNSEIKPSDDTNSFEKKHIRQNSYTLDEPSSALILAHADCTCNFDADCTSPHCSALKGENEVRPNSAFTKEKVEVDIPISHHQMKKLPVLSAVNSPEKIIVNKEDMASTVIDVFPIVQEDSCKKLNSGNAEVSEAIAPVSESESAAEVNSNPKTDDKRSLNEMFPEAVNLSADERQEYFRRIYQELQESHEMRVKELFEVQNQQWLKLQEEFNFLYEKLKLTLTASPPKPGEKDQIENDCCSIENTADNAQACEKELSISNPAISSSDLIPTSDNSPVQNSELSVSSYSPQTTHSPSSNLTVSPNVRASLSPSSDSKTSPSRPLENIKSRQLFKDSDSSLPCNFNNIDNHDNFHSNVSVQNGFPCTTTSVLLPHCNSPPNAVAVPSSEKCDNTCACFCDNSVMQCKCCSFNGYCELDVNISQTEYASTSREQNSVSNAKISSSDIDFLHSQTSSSTSGIQGKSLNSEDFINCYNANSSKKVLSSSSRKSDDPVSTTKNVMASSVNDLELSSAVNNKDRNILPHLLKEKAKTPVGRIVSMYSKTLSKGSNAQAATANKRIVDDPLLLKKFEKLPALVKGYLTRRLYKTERVQSLIKTLQDTALLIGKLSEELSMKGDSVSERDVDFHRQLIVQLMTTFHNVYDIFCTISTKERMAIIAESRNQRLKQKTLDQKQELTPPVTTKAPEPAPSKKHKLTSATLKALERKRRPIIDSRTYTLEDSKNARSRSTIEMRTYTIDDLDNFRGRTHSSMSSKNLSVSPSSIYKNSVGMYMKRKTASAKSSGSRRCLHHKWVP